MREKPLVLSVAWGKNRRGSAPLDTPRGDKIPLDPEEEKGAAPGKMRTSPFLYSILRPKKEKPRGNGARNRGKT